MIGAGAIADDHCTSVSQYPGAELVADPGVDAVMIALPNVLHAPVSVASLKAGKHVLLEKPFALYITDNWKPVAVSGPCSGLRRH